MKGTLTTPSFQTHGGSEVQLLESQGGHWASRLGSAPQETVSMHPRPQPVPIASAPNIQAFPCCYLTVKDFTRFGDHPSLSQSRVGETLWWDGF